MFLGKCYQCFNARKNLTFESNQIKPIIAYIRNFAEIDFMISDPRVSRNSLENRSRLVSLSCEEKYENNQNGNDDQDLNQYVWRNHDKFTPALSRRIEISSSNKTFKDSLISSSYWLLSERISFVIPKHLKKSLKELQELTGNIDQLF